MLCFRCITVNTVHKGDDYDDYDDDNNKDVAISGEVSVINKEADKCGM